MELLKYFAILWRKYMCFFCSRDPWVPLAEFEKFNKIKELLNELDDDNVEKHIIKALEVNFCPL